MASTTFETRLNNAIEEKGYRISPRLGLEDRLARYIELTWIDRGEPLTSDEISAVVALTMVNNSTEDAERTWRTTEGAEWRDEPRRSARVAARQQSEDWEPRRSSRVTAREAQSSEESWQPRRSSRIAASSRNVTATNDNLRVSFTPGAQSAGAHPMVRRSQVTRR